jgi:GH24 family phage-related lysozyme (muramidase)
MQRMSDKGIDFIARHEGFVGRLYNDPVGHCTVGFGHLVHLGNCDGRPSETPFLQGMTYQQGQDLLRRDVARFEDSVRRLIKVPLNQNQFDALVSFTFNLGEGRLKEIAPGINAGQFADVPAVMLRYSYARKNGTLIKLQALERRRKQEGELFATPVDLQDKRLRIPYVSQLGPQADYGRGDCGIACVTQLALAAGRTITVNALSEMAGLQPGYTWAHIMIHVHTAARKMGIQLEYHSKITADRITREILDNRSVLLLVYYPMLDKRFDKGYRSGHFITVHGTEGDHFYYDDPYWPSARQGEDIRISKAALIAAAHATGDHFKMPGQALLLRSHRLADILRR